MTILFPLVAALLPGLIAFGAIALGTGALGAALIGAAAALVLTPLLAARRSDRPEIRQNRSVGRGLVGVLLVVAPFQWSAFNLSQILVLAIGALGLVLLSGQTGQISVAQGPFVGAGAYTSAVLSVKAGVPELLTVPIAVLAGALFGLIVGVPSARLRGVYQVITTLAVGVAFPSLLVVIGDPVGGSVGLPTSNPFDVTVAFGRGQQLDPSRLMYIVCALCTLLAWFVLARIISSRHGVALRAIKQNEVVAAINGVRVGQYRVLAFVLSAALAGLAGGLYALTVGAVSPDSFGLAYSIQFLVAVAIGGVDRLAGGIVGAVAVFLITTQVKGIHVPHSTTVISNEVIYGLVVIVVLLAFEGGVWGAVTAAARWLNAQARRRFPAPPVRPI
jgi:branched-chain amino acid transport system permease protein